MPRPAFKPSTLSSRPARCLQNPGKTCQRRWNSSAARGDARNATSRGKGVQVALAAALLSGGIAYAAGFKQADGKHQKAKAYSSPEKFTGPKYGSVEDMKHVSDFQSNAKNSLIIR